MIVGTGRLTTMAKVFDSGNQMYPPQKLFTFPPPRFRIMKTAPDSLEGVFFERRGRMLKKILLLTVLAALLLAVLARAGALKMEIDLDEEEGDS